LILHIENSKYHKGWNFDRMHSASVEHSFIQDLVRPDKDSKIRVKPYKNNRESGKPEERVRVCSEN